MAIYLGSTFATYNYYANNSAKALEVQAADGQTKTETAYYEANIGKVKTVDDLVSNYRLFNYAMTAYGLSDMVYAKAFMTKVLTSDTTDKTSFANKLADNRFTNFAKAFANLNTDSATTTDTTTSSGSTDTSATTTTGASTETVVNAYLQQSMETELGQSDQGVQLALYFKRNAASVSSAYGLLGDSAMWKVISTVYGLPASLGSMDTDTQKSVVESKMDITDLQDSTKVDKLLQRFTAIWDATENVGTDPILTLFGGGSSNSSADGTLALFL